MGEAQPWHRHSRRSGGPTLRAATGAIRLSLRALTLSVLLGGALGPGALAAHGQALGGHACASIRDPTALELGQATYYHPSLINQPMANGRPYDPANPLLAASNRYRIGTVLRVTRVDRPEVIVVEVVDRGGDGLELDLSEAAFARLAALSEGNIAVCIEQLS